MRDINRDSGLAKIRIQSDERIPRHVLDSHQSDGQQLIISALPRHFPRCCSTAEAPHHHSLHIRTERTLDRGEKWARARTSSFYDTTVISIQYWFRRRPTADPVNGLELWLRVSFLTPILWGGFSFHCQSDLIDYRYGIWFFSMDNITVVQWVFL